MATAHKPQGEDKTSSQDEVAQLIANFTKERIRPTFRRQKLWKGKQFAVINFWSEHDCATGLQAVQFTPEPELDPAKVSVPQTLSEDISCNYVVARPQRSTKHAEKILMNRLEQLNVAYTEFNEKQPKVIYIYSHYMPCVKCARLITNKLRSPPYNHIPVVVAYSAPYNEGDSTAEKIFTDNQCSVYHVV